ncbi:MAG TPA: hypothetical protein VEF06_07800 [Bryobacteraceae bacterium]|nr:hypothetical protein [Bryobacteraceae bacterium]
MIPIRSRALFSLLFAALLAGTLLSGCSPSPPPKPDLPASVSPGWKQDSFASIPKPADLPGSPECWKAHYSGQGTAEVEVCGYPNGAFDAAQRAAAQGQTVKFDQGKYFVRVRWNDSAKPAVTALVRAIQKSLH